MWVGLPDCPPRGPRQSRIDKRHSPLRSRRLKDWHVVAMQRRIGGDDGQGFQLGLRNEEAIEWIVVVAGQRGNAQCMTVRDLQALDSGSPNPRGHVRVGRFRQWQPATASPQRRRLIPASRRRDREGVPGQPCRADSSS
jgi:hypothetical protein